MSELFVDRLIDAIDAKDAPICVGIDPILDSFPEEIRPANQRNLDDCVDAIYEFCSGVLHAVAPIAPIVKFQSAYFEKYLWEGVRTYYELIEQAKELGLLVIGDVKRGDIGSTSEAYATAHLADLEFGDLEDVTTPDAITINPFLGMDTLEPFLRVCEDEGKGVFVLVRTSNPGSTHLQDVLTKDGQSFSEMIAGMLQARAVDAKLMGTKGYSNIGAVVGATQTHTMQSLRAKLPSSIFLLPGYGTQGATGEMTKAAFDKNGHGAIVSASRSVLYPKRNPGESWQQAIKRAAGAMAVDLRNIVGGHG